MSDVAVRMADVAAGWTFTEPLLLAVWNIHEIIETSSIETLRTGARRVEYNAAYIRSLGDHELAELLRFEMVRVVLGHPYRRRLPDAELAFTSSNLAVQESIQSGLPIPPAAEVFQDPEMSFQTYETYYRQLRALSEPSSSPEESPPEESSLEESSPEESPPEGNADSDRADSDGDENNAGEKNADNGDGQSDDGQSFDDDSGASSGPSQPSAALGQHVDGTAASTELWRDDDLTLQQIDLAVQRAATESRWGSLGSQARERLLARTPSRLDYAAVLRRFRRSAASSRRTLTRMRANRRYGLQQMGSRYETQMRLLMAVDVSGSMSLPQISRGLTIVNRLFGRGVCQIDVLQFDNQIVGSPVNLRRRRIEFQIGGRGGTDFGCILDYAAAHRHFDGLIIYTDGQAEPPRWPRDLRPRHRPPITWLLSDRDQQTAVGPGLEHLGFVTHIA